MTAHRYYPDAPSAEWPKGEPPVPADICRHCSGTGLATDDGTFRRQTSTTEADCGWCSGAGYIEETA